jgi:ligand-binding sensor domain-containing protein
MKTLLVILLHVFALGSVSVAQPSCLVTHYTRNQYAAGSQNWSIDIDKQGFVYIANNHGLLKFDGVRWRMFPLPARTIVRSVSIGSDERIYTGSNEEFGYWEKNPTLGLKYISLVPLLKKYNLHNQEIWKIVQFGNKVYFQGFHCLFVYDHQSVKPIALPGSIIFLLKAGNRLFAHAVQGDLYEVVNDKLVKLRHTEALRETEVKAIIPYYDNSFLIGTSSQGVFVLDQNGIKAWNVPANPFLKESQINNGILFGDKIVFGTIVKGIFVLDLSGNILNHLFTENNLQNNTVLSLCNENNQSIWVGLDNGIDNVSFSNPVDIYPVGKENLGTVYTAVLKDNVLYVGTNRGIFTYNKTGDTFEYQGFMNNSQGQVWQLKDIDGTLFCGHNHGTSIISSNQLNPVTNVSGGYMLQKMFYKDHEFLIQSTYSNLLIYNKSGSGWDFSHAIDNFLEPVRFIETDHLGNVWLGHTIKGLYRLRLSDSLDKVSEIQIFNDANGFHAEANIKVFKVANRIVFSNGEKLFTWDDISQKIIPFTEFNSKLLGFEAATCIVPIDENNYWFSTKTEAAIFNIKGNDPSISYRLIMRMFNIKMVDGYENIIPLNENLHLICLDNGFAIFNKKAATPVTGKNTLKLAFRDFVCVNSSGDARNIEFENKTASLPNAYNNISVAFSTIESPCSHKLYQYRLDGIDTTWSNWSEIPEAKYTRLPVGRYSLEVRSISLSGTLTEPVTLTFIVKPAWYASIAAIIIYILIGLGGIIASQYFFRKRIVRQHNQINQDIEEKRKSEQQQATQEIMKLQNEKLEAEIAHKNMQLADSTLSIIRKNEVLIEIKSELEKQKEELGSRYPARYLQRLTTLIDRNISNDNDWEIFEALFDQAHENFFKRLKHSFPELTQSDLKLCAYLKLNLSSKEIAPLLNISIRGVEIRRYRLRKRLALASDNNLVEFIMQF